MSPRAGRTRAGRKRGGRNAPPPAPAPTPASKARRAPASSASRRGYDPSAADPRDSEYHYGSDFGDESGEASEPEESPASSSSEWSGAEEEARESESEIDGGGGGGGEFAPGPPPGPEPEPAWLRGDGPVPELKLPPSSEDLTLPGPLALRTTAVCEALRRFRHAARLSPFRAEDMCAALACDEASSLLVEVHVALLRSLLREEDSQQTHFGPVDHKDSVNLALFLLDRLTWPEALKSYVESDPRFDRTVVKALDSNEYPFASAEDRIVVLEFLCDQFLATNPIREDLTGEVSIRYDDHCRSCHRLGDLLCCETCPAVYHLECVDPPLVDVPSEDWQCSLCESHRLPGVTDCISDAEKQGALCRHERLGFDRHGRKYWFVCRRIFVEAEDETVWYYSTVPQFEELLDALDSRDLESALYEELAERKAEICRQMETTLRITEQLKGNRKSYLETANALILRARNEGTGASPTDDPSVQNSNDSASKMESEEKPNVNPESETEGADDKAENKTEGASEENHRLTRLKYNELASGAQLYKLGNEGNFRNYVNQYTVNAMALNKPQRNEERDKKRHLAHKFSLSCGQEFKWVGLMNATKSLLINTLRQTILQLETNVASVFMHPNWSLLRRAWLQAVHACNIPRDFARALVVLQACIKNVVFVPVWHEQLGHVRLQRITAGEREERKKLEKREKKEKEEEEEKNKVSSFVRYPIPMKHQIWKQKGEEYRIHGQWGWLWHSSTRKFRKLSKSRHSLSSGPLKIMVQVKINDVDKVITVHPKTHNYLAKNELNALTDVSDDLRNMKIYNPQLEEFEEIDVEKSLSSNVRVAYPKIGKKSRLDDMLSRRIQLKVLEERKCDKNVFLQKKQVKDEDEEQNIDVENVENDGDSSLLINSTDSAARPTFSKVEVATMTKEIQSLRQQYAEAIQLARGYKCYTRGCDANNATLSQGVIFTINCYSPLCIKKANMRRDLLLLLNKVQNSSNMKNNLNGSKTQQTSSTLNTESKEYVNDIIKDLSTAVASAYKFDEKLMHECFKMSLKIKNELENCEMSNGDQLKSEPTFEESVIPAVGSEMELDQDISPDEVGDLDVGDSEKIVDDYEPGKKCKRERKYRDVSFVKEDTENYDGDRPPIPKLRISTRNRSSKSHSTNLDTEVSIKKVYKPLYTALFNRRFCLVKNSTKREEKVIKSEYAPDGTIREYSTLSTAGKIYLKKIVSADSKRKRSPVKYPLCSTFHTKSRAKSILVLPAHELRKLARLAGRFQVSGYNHNSKQNSGIWPYPCSRPLFKTCWLYRTINMTSLAAVALQIRILWSCIRWDDMTTKPNGDGKNQITTETEIITLEMLKHRHIGQFLDKTQYLRRKVVIPLEVPKTIREVTSIRSGLRKRKRAESPQSMEPQVTEEWVDEDKLELWEIKQYGEKVERAVPITRTSTGKLPPSRNLDNKDESTITNTPKLSAQEMKEKLEQQLRLQRAAHQQKRAQELQGNLTPTGAKGVIGTKRVFMTKGADGTTRVVTQPGVLSKTPNHSSQSLIKTPNNQTPKEGLQKVQIIRGPDGKISVRGLIAGQQLIQMPDGKLHVVAPGQQGNLPVGGQVIATGGAAPTPKIAVTPGITPHSKPITSIGQTPLKPIAPVSSATPSTPTNKVIIRQQIKPIAAVPTDKQTPQRIVTRSGQPILLQGNQQVIVQSPQHVIVQGQPKIASVPLVQVSQGTVLQTGNKPLQTVVVQGASTQLTQAKVVQGQVLQSGQQVIQGTTVLQPITAQQLVTNTGQAKFISPQQVVVNHQSVANQLNSGKLQYATINGQQVLVRPLGNNQIVVVGQIAPQNSIATDINSQNQVTTTTAVIQGQTTVAQNISTVAGIVTPQPNQISPVKQGSPLQANPPPQSNQPTAPLTDEQIMERRLLAGQPPGTMIKTVTAQVVHLDGGPRIVLQGLTGNSLTPQQLFLVQQQVKQQLLKAQETTGKVGMVGPTKIYLAVQPSASTPGTLTTNSPVVSTVCTPQHNQISQESKTITALLQSNPNKARATSVLLNGQDPNEPPAHIVLKPNTNTSGSAKLDGDQLESDMPSSNKFVLTPDYIQQTIKNALKQENLNPEIEEKLLQLQRYQEKQMKPESNNQGGNVTYTNIRSISNTPASSQTPSSLSRRRPVSTSRNTDDDDWIESVPRKRNRPSNIQQERHEPPEEPKNVVTYSRSRPSRLITHVPQQAPQSSYSNTPPSPVDPRRTTHHSKLPLLLFRHKELLKKDIIKKRGLLEKELGIEIQKELSAELALRTKAERTKEEEVVTPVINTPSSSSRRRPLPSGMRNSATPSHTPSSSRSSKQRKKEKLLCICQTPYDETKFYVGCEHCNNWFHGDCVGITEEMSKTINEFVCSECKHARDTQELYCLCRQPYDNSQFYICCDRCQDWFHGRCVGILQSEADNIDEYICPNCQKNNSVNYANMKELSNKDFDNLKKLIKQIQGHKSAWPFMEPVDPREAPMYYKVIKEPMDLQVIEKKINDQTYNMLSEFIGDMTKIFDNCRYFNPKESQFYRCAETLEAFFVQKIKFFREKLFETNQ